MRRPGCASASPPSSKEFTTPSADPSTGRQKHRVDVAHPSVVEADPPTPKNRPGMILLLLLMLTAGLTGIAYAWRLGDYKGWLSSSVNPTMEYYKKLSNSVNGSREHMRNRCEQVYLLQSDNEARGSARLEPSNCSFESVKTGHEGRASVTLTEHR
ncbi:hypothetical protein HPB52_006828 [Rhipicephalus sanguineus]|uniref:Uncharacterized protein n=1 Tax=Rhipicephalus sanguineus TaxID=34632 RepID=A0A9D4PHF8_RHISA|nr:hypothetical protein HPB52_006828 [Rhipicephalus sanguineus]